MIEQRSQGRLLTRVKAQARIENTPDNSIPAGTVLECQTRDISIGGICLQMGDPLPVGTTIRLSIELTTSGKTFEHLSQVSWCRKKGDIHLVGLHLTEHLCDVNMWKPAVINILVGN